MDQLPQITDEWKYSYPTFLVVTKKNDKYEITTAQFHLEENNEVYWQFGDCSYDYLMGHQVYYWMEMIDLPEEIITPEK